MGFVVDKVSEDSFYENLLLGLSKVLEKSPCVSNLSLKRIPGARQVDIRAWEHSNGIILPEDLRAFYSSTDGFLYTYDFSYDYRAGDEGQRCVRRGKIEVNPLAGLTRTYGYETKAAAQIEKVGGKYKLTLSRDSHVYELCNVDDVARVVLVYVDSYSTPGVWLYGSPMTFSHLAADFTTYLRMCVAHLGIPRWQLMKLPGGVPEWTREMFLLLAPGVVAEDRTLVEAPQLDAGPVNRIDAGVFSIEAAAIGGRGAVVKAGRQDGSGRERRGRGVARHASAKAGRKSGVEK